MMPSNGRQKSISMFYMHVSKHGSDFIPLWTGTQLCSYDITPTRYPGHSERFTKCPKLPVPPRLSAFSCCYRTIKKYNQLRMNPCSLTRALIAVSNDFRSSLLWLLSAKASRCFTAAFQRTSPATPSSCRPSPPSSTTTPCCRASSLEFWPARRSS